MITIGVIVLSWVTWLTVERQRRPEKSEGIHWLKYGLSLKAVGVFFAAALIYAPMYEYLHGRTLPGIVIGTFILVIGGQIFLLAFFWSVGYDERGIYTRSPWRQSRFVPWSELTSFSFSSLMKQWIIHTQFRGAIRINELVPGADILVEELRKRGVRGTGL